MNNIYDIVIIGSGPTGISCAIEAKKNRFSTLILEKGMLTNSIYHFPTNMTFFSTSLKLEIGDVPFISHNEKPTRMEALEYYRRVIEHWELEIKFREEATSIDNQGNGFTVSTINGTYDCKHVIVATGFYDNYRKLNVLGEDLPKVKHYYDDVHPYIQQKVMVVGAANSACDVALETWSKGADVTMVIRGDELYQKIKYWILPNIQNRIKEGSIKAYFNSTIKKITETEVLIDTPEGVLSIDNDYVLAMTGYTPNYKLLAQFGIKWDGTELQIPIHNKNTLESNRKGLYIAGVIKGGLHTNRYFIENTREHGEKIIQDILLKSSIS
jgi:thioredoxin reductase (NADPH)